MVDLVAVVRLLWLRRWWILASIVACTALASLYAFATPRIYRATVLMVPADFGRGGAIEGTLGRLGGLASLAGIQIGDSNSAKQEALAVLRSRELTEAFISARNLMPLLFPQRWDKSAQRWKAGVKPPSVADAYKLFDQEVRTVSEDKKTGLISLQIDWVDRNLAADWANDLVQRLNIEMQTRAKTSAAASVGYLEKELQVTTTVDTREAISRLIEAQIRQRMLANVTREYAFRIVDRAMAPDEDDPVRPRKMLALAGGVIGGGVLGALVVFVVAVASAGQNSRAATKQSNEQR